MSELREHEQPRGFWGVLRDIWAESGQIADSPALQVDMKSDKDKWRQDMLRKRAREIAFARSNGIAGEHSYVYRDACRELGVEA